MTEAFHLQLIKLLIFVFLNLINFHKVKLENSVNYTINEECQVGYKLGNIITDLNQQFHQIKRTEVGSNKCQLFDLTESSVNLKLFRIDQDNCDLFVNQRINREALCPNQKKSQTKSTVKLNKDKCLIQLSGFVASTEMISLNIEVKDINDCKPYFQDDNETLKILIKENTRLGFEVDLPIAKDDDLGVNAILVYAMQPQSNKFKLKQDNLNNLKMVVIGELDYEDPQQQNFSAVIKACDHGDPKLCGYKSIVVQLLDQNDNSPKFTTKEPIELTIKEDLPVGSTLMTLRAKDADSNVYGLVEYDLLDTPIKTALEYFAINQSSGQITLSKSLSSWDIKEDLIKLIVTARDNMNDPKNSRATKFTVQLRVEDINNHRPIIQIKPTLNPHSLQIKENMKPGVTLGLIIVTDQDRGVNGQVSCHLNSSDHKLSLDFWRQVGIRSTYQLKSQLQFDRELIESIQSIVVCLDHGTPRLSSIQSISVAIIDENEFAPDLKLSQITVQVSEGSPFNTTIGRALAHDEDKEAVLEYYLELNNKKLVTSDRFWITKDGWIKLGQVSLDREKQDQVKLVVYVVDKSPPKYLTASATMTIIIDDVNDNAPELLEPRIFQMLENMSPNSGRHYYAVGNLRSMDKDVGENATVRYYLDSIKFLPMLNHQREDTREYNRNFTIDERTGEMHALSPIDREVCEEIQLNIVLKDQGNPQLSTRESVKIIVLDENDNAPYWIFPSKSNFQVNFTTIIPDLNIENTAGYNKMPFQPVTVIKAIDSDTPINANISYRIISAKIGNTNVNNFHLNSQTGHMTCNGYIADGVYKLKLEATDNGKPPLIANEILYIHAQPQLGYLNSRISTTLIVALATLTLIICMTLLTAIFIVRRNRYPDNSRMSNDGDNINHMHHNLVNDSLNKWTEEQSKFIQNAPPHQFINPKDCYGQQYCSSFSFVTSGNNTVNSKLGEPLLPPPGPKDVLHNINGQSYTLMHLRRPTNQDLDVASADSGRGASEEENGSHFNDCKNRFKNKVYLTMPATQPISIVTNNTSSNIGNTNCYDNNYHQNPNMIKYVTYGHGNIASVLSSSSSSPLTTNNHNSTTTTFAPSIHCNKSISLTTNPVDELDLHRLHTNLDTVINETASACMSQPQHQHLTTTHNDMDVCSSTATSHTQNILNNELSSFRFH